MKQQMSQLKITVCISLMVTLFFAFRAEAEGAAVVESDAWGNPAIEMKWKKVDDITDANLQVVATFNQAARSLQQLQGNSCLPPSETTLGVPNVYYNGWLKVGVPEKALRKALAYEMRDPHAGDAEKAISNKEWMTIIDYTAPSTESRMYVLNLKTGEVIKSLVAHGKGSDDGTGKAVKFSNQDSSLQTSPGFLKISDHIVSPKHGPAFKLEGLEDRNSQVAKRAIILHSASYVSEAYVQQHGFTGRSWGCPAVSSQMLKVLYSKNISGSLLYGYTAEDAMASGTAG